MSEQTLKFKQNEKRVEFCIEVNAIDTDISISVNFSQVPILFIKILKISSKQQPTFEVQKYYKPKYQGLLAGS